METPMQPPSNEALQAMLAEQEAERQKMLTQIQQEYAKEDSTTKEKGMETPAKHDQRHPPRPVR